MIAIIDYGSGNVSAIAAVYKSLSIDHAVVNDPSSLALADRYILPGVGNFDFTMAEMIKSGLYDLLTEQVIRRGKPLLGICVGMQLLADSSEEGHDNGLGWIGGRVRRIPGSGVRLPHMGWNSISIESDPVGLFENINPEIGFYFLHNFHFDVDNAINRMAVTNYGTQLTCAVSNNTNIFGVQFHPEKSHENGIRLFKNFSTL